MSAYLTGCDVLGADVIPSVGATYTDHVTVMAVQQALLTRGFDPGPIDGIYGPKTARGIRAMQASVGAGQTGVIDYGVLMALRVPTPGAATVAPAAPRASIMDPYAQLLPGAHAPLAASSVLPLEGWSAPLWEGSPVKRWQAVLGGLAGAAVAIGVVMARRK